MVNFAIKEILWIFSKNSLYYLFLIFWVLIHIGELIKQTLKQRRKSVVWFAGELSCSRTNVYKIFSKQSIDTFDLYRISKILDYNFFEIYYKELQNQE